MLHRRWRRRARSKPDRARQAADRLRQGDLAASIGADHAARAGLPRRHDTFRSSLPSGLTASRVLISTVARSPESTRREQIYDFSAVFRFDIPWRVFSLIRGTSISRHDTG